MDNTQHDNESQDQQQNAQGSSSMKNASPEDVKNKVKETVQRGVAAVAGALKGFSEQAKSENLAESSKEAIQKAGETTREVAGTVRQEFQDTKKELTSGSTGSSGSSSSSGSSGSSSSFGSSSSGGSSSGTMGMGGSQLGSGSGSTSMGEVGSTGGVSSSPSGVPDLRKTDLAKKDEELVE